MDYDYYAILLHLSGYIRVIDLKTHYFKTAWKRFFKTANDYDMTEDYVALHCLFKYKYDEDKGVYIATYDEDYFCERTVEAKTFQDLIDAITSDAFS